MNEESAAVEPEVIEGESRELTLRRPHVPTDINELAALEQNRGRAIIEQRADILETLRAASIKLTMPNDWTLFKDRDGRITGYLGDQGCDRVKKLWGIQIDNLSQMERIPPVGLATDNAFAFRITGDGHCGMTGESVFEMEGIRYSNEHYATEKPDGIQREVAVRKASRANLDGGICRELTGMKSVPSEEIEKAWAGTWKKLDMCNKGRGFGSADERVGGAGATGIDPQDIPICEVCESRGKKGVRMLLRKGSGNRGDFWGCPNYKSHEDKPFTYDDAKLRREIAERKKLTAESDAPAK